MKRMALFACLLGALGIAACGSSGDEHDAIVECKYTEHSLAWEEASLDGIVPADLLAFAEISVSSASATIGPQRLETADTISLDVSRRGTYALYQEGQNCPDRLEIPLSFSFSTDDSNTFDETFEVTAVEQDGKLVVNHTFKQEELAGDFAPPPPASGGTIYRMSLEATFHPEHGGTAEIFAHVERRHGDSVSSSMERQWGWEW